MATIEPVLLLEDGWFPDLILALLLESSERAETKSRESEAENNTKSDDLQLKFLLISGCDYPFLARFATNPRAGSLKVEKMEGEEVEGESWKLQNHANA